MPFVIYYNGKKKAVRKTEKQANFYIGNKVRHHSLSGSWDVKHKKKKR
jgi:hypothetical protein